MDNIVNDYRNWSDFNTNKKVGVITTIFSEQYLNLSFEILPLTPENYEEEIELYDIDTVFIDNDLFEADHPWFRKNRGYLLIYLKHQNINICVIKNTLLEVNKVFKSPFVMEIKPFLNEYREIDNVLQTPLIVDQHLHNPINSQKNMDVLYFSAGKLKASPQTKLYNNTYKPKMHIVKDGRITRHSLKKLFSFLKKTKVLYICESKKIDEVTLNYIETIAYLNSTNVILDYTYEATTMYSYNSKDDKNNLAKQRILINSEVYCLKQALLTQRQALTNNTSIFNVDLSTYLFNSQTKKMSPQISVITSTNRNQNLDFYLSQLNNQKNVNLEVNLVTHGFEIDEIEKNKYREKYQFPINFLSQTVDKTLGECLNTAIDSSTYDIISKIDDDDYYMDYYLYDQWLAMQYSQASVVGKSDGYYYFEEDDLIARRNIDRYYSYDYFIMGATIMAEGELIRKLKFSNIPRAVDTDFLRRTNENGAKIFIGHPFEMCVYRAASQEGHTWKVNDLTMLKSSEIVGFGEPNSYIRL